MWWWLSLALYAKAMRTPWVLSTFAAALTSESLFVSSSSGSTPYADRTGGLVTKFAQIRDALIEVVKHRRQRPHEALSGFGGERSSSWSASFH